MRAAQARDQPGLAAEAPLVLVVAGGLGREALEGDDPVVLGVVGLEHLTHPASADHAE